MIWPNHVLHLTSNSGKCTKIRCTGSIYSLLNEKDWSSIKQDRTQSSSSIHSQACCISKTFVMKSEEIIYQKVYVSPRPPPKTSNKDNWMNELDSEVAGSSKETQRIELKPNTQLSSTGRPVKKKSEETLERTKFDRDNIYQEKHDNVKDSTSKGRPVCGHEKIILIEQHFKPTCSKITCTIQSARIRRRWSTNWVMRSYLSCARLHQRYNVPNVFFTGIKELCTALADIAWFTANPEESLTN